MFLKNVLGNYDIGIHIVAPEKPPKKTASLLMLLGNRGYPKFPVYILTCVNFSEILMFAVAAADDFFHVRRDHMIELLRSTAV